MKKLAVIILLSMGCAVELDDLPVQETLDGGGGETGPRRGPSRGFAAAASPDAHFATPDTTYAISEIRVVVPDGGIETATPPLDVKPGSTAISCIQRAIDNGYASNLASCDSADTTMGYTPSNCRKVLDCLAANWPCDFCCFKRCQTQGTPGVLAVTIAKALWRDITIPFCGPYMDAPEYSASCI